MVIKIKTHDYLMLLVYDLIRCNGYKSDLVGNYPLVIWHSHGKRPICRWQKRWVTHSKRWYASSPPYIPMASPSKTAWNRWFMPDKSGMNHGEWNWMDYVGWWRVTGEFEPTWTNAFKIFVDQRFVWTHMEVTVDFLFFCYPFLQ